MSDKELISEKYDLLFDKDDTFWCIKLKESCGLWNGLIYGYEKVTFLEDTKIRYAWKAHYVPESLKGVKADSEILQRELEKLLADVLLDLFLNDKIEYNKEENKLLLKFPAEITP